MTFDRAVCALLNGKAIRREKNKFIRIASDETHHWITGPSGYPSTCIYTDIHNLTADDWECGSYDAKTKKVVWDNVVYDGHARPIDRFEDMTEKVISKLPVKAGTL